VKEFWKAANICQSYERMYSGTVLSTHCVHASSITRIVSFCRFQVISLVTVPWSSYYRNVATTFNTRHLVNALTTTTR